MGPRRPGIVGQNGGMSTVPRSYGTGPGVIIPDGCAVDFYAMMPDFGEAAIVHEAAGPGASVLELGCGAGRVTHPLIALGHPVVAVDESPEMLAHVSAAETVRARIQDLALGRRFGAVLLASHLINADDETRRAFLGTCRRHVADDGCAIIQQHSPSWFQGARDSQVTRDGVVMRMRDVSRPAPNLVSATVEYVAGDRHWTQTFTTTRLDEAELAAALADAGLRLDRYLTEDRSWLRAVPVTVPGSAPGSVSGWEAYPPLLRRNERRLTAGPWEPCTLPVSCAPSALAWALRLRSSASRNLRFSSSRSASALPGWSSGPGGVSSCGASAPDCSTAIRTS
jgi:SAM-dependent methyltransferase